MHYGFFADKEDKLALLNFIFSKTEFLVFESYSLPDVNLRVFKSAEEIERIFELEKGGEYAVCLALCMPEHSNKVIFRKLALNPLSNDGATFRYAINGWGLINLYFGGQKKNVLHQSKISGWNEQGALKQEPYDELGMGNVGDWDWKEVQSSFRKLRYQIHQKMAVKYSGARGILPGANDLIHTGFRLL